AERPAALEGFSQGAGRGGAGEALVRGNGGGGGRCGAKGALRSAGGGVAGAGRGERVGGAGRASRLSVELRGGPYFGFHGCGGRQPQPRPPQRDEQADGRASRLSAAGDEPEGSREMVGGGDFPARESGGAGRDL